MILPAALTPLLADGGDLLDTITWKQVLAIVGPTLAAVCSSLWWAASRFYRGKVKNLEYQVEVLKSRAAHLQDDVKDEKKETARLRKEAEAKSQQIAERDAHLADLKKRLVPYYHHYQKLRPLYDKAAKELAGAQELVAKLTEQTGSADERLKVLTAEVERRQQELDRTERRVRKALRLEGNLWAAKALQKVPKFRPASARRRAIISVLNLKGGVGKTTVTAHLGLALARRGYRVLLVDLDLQGSLTTLFLPFEKIEHIRADQRLVHNFLAEAAVDPTVKLLGYAEPVLEDPSSGGRIGLVGAADSLAYAEFNLTMSWLLGRGDRDCRFLLRKALHLMAVTAGYDIVLLDCPPLINISCVNALAASDYVLVPVTPSRRAIERVPVLIGRYLRNEKFRKHVNHDLKVLGLVANRTYRDQLTAAERAEWEQLAIWCRDAYGQDVKQFQTVVPEQVKDIRTSETLLTLPDMSTRLAQVFAALASEIEQELPSECRRGAEAPV